MAEQKAKEHMKEAQKTLLTSGGFLGGLFGGSSKIDDAIDLYTKAATQFKIAKMWYEAGNAYTEAATLSIKIKNKPQAACSYADAASCYKKCDPQKAGKSLKKAIELYTDAGRYSLAAKMHQQCAELYETEAKDIAEAMKHYEQAAEYYKGQESNTQASRCTLKLAGYAAQYGQYDKAIGIYEEVAASRIDSSLLKYSANEYFFRAALCHLCVDFLNAQIAVKKYEEMFPMFSDSRECKCIKQLIKCVDIQDPDKFEEAEKLYHSLIKGDLWYQMIVLRIKEEKLVLVGGGSQNIC